MAPITVYFIQTFCDHCERILSEGRAKSFFTCETICLDCSRREEGIRAKIREDVGADADLEFEECGFVPRIKGPGQ